MHASPHASLLFTSVSGLNSSPPIHPQGSSSPSSCPYQDRKCSVSGSLMPVSLAGSLRSSSHNITRHFSCLDASELATITSLKFSPRGRKKSPRAQACHLKQPGFQGAICETPHSSNSATSRALPWFAAVWAVFYDGSEQRLLFRSGLTQPTSLHFILQTLTIIVPLVEDAAVFNSSLPLWLEHFSNLKVLLFFLHLEK